MDMHASSELTQSRAGTVLTETTEAAAARRVDTVSRVAIVQYWMNGYGGAERVLEAWADIFPNAHLYSPMASDRGIPTKLQNMPLKTSFLGHLPGIKRWHRHFFPLYPYALEQFDLSGYDLVISSESGPAKGVITSPQTCHICYCLSPMRYIWDMYHQYRRSMNPLVGTAFSLAAHYARVWDVSTAARVDYFVAISSYVAARIRKYYRRESTVIHPPVDVSAGYISPKTEDYYLVVSRLVPYKRVDLAIAACNRLGRRLRIAGTGPEYGRLRKLAGPRIEFLGGLDDQALRENYAQCRALLFPAEEDFGIVPVEAQSFGRAVIAFARGGALETVVGIPTDRECDAAQATGVFFDEQSPDALSQAMLRFETTELRFRPEMIRAQAQQFGIERFNREFSEFVQEKLAEFRSINSPMRQSKEPPVVFAGS
jgi:glycosyltransferase involved in cell wall biosynthesis